MLSLAAPWALALLPVPLLVWWALPPHRERVRAIRIPFFREVTEAMGVEPRAGASVLARSSFQMTTAAIIWALIVLALARPERLGDPITIDKAARDIVLALDISGSMDEADFISEDGNRQQRLAAVKEVVAQFIAARETDRMALIVFGTRAFVQAPFTDDLQSLTGFLDQTAVGMAGPNTALGDAIGLALRTFDGSAVEERVMILLSDGADTGSRMSPGNAAAIAADRDVTIHTIGVGDPEASGEDRVDLAALEDIAKTTDGQYFYASDQEALADVYTQIDALTPRLTESTSYRPRLSLTHIPLAAALILLISATGALHFAAERRRQS